jgi:hypothetical protein
MKVAQLIAALQKLPQDARVVYEYDCTFHYLNEPFADRVPVLMELPNGRKVVRVA